MRFAERVRHGFVVLVGALLMLWPALLNGYPLLNADSMSYLWDGYPLTQILLRHGAKGYEAMRSEIYSLGIYPFHRDVTVWPVVVLQALLTSYVLWLVVRSFSISDAADAAERSPVAGRVEAQFLVLVGLLSLLTSVSWFVSLVMPDILGSVLYLCIYLLVFARESLSRVERWGVAAIAAWAIGSHTTHLLVAAGVCVFLALLSILRWPPMRARGWAIGGVMALVLLVAGAQMALHGYLYGRPSLTGDPPPFLMARIIADGPGSWYLQQNCGTLQWAICKWVGDLPVADDAFLWDVGGIWDRADVAEQRQMRQEEMPLVLGAVRAYPRAEFERSLGNFREQLREFGLWIFRPNEWISRRMYWVLPGAETKYPRTLQARDALPIAVFSRVQWWVVMASALAIVVSVPVMWRRRRWRLLGLAAIVVSALIVNAWVTGVLSAPNSRYGARVIWLVPLLVGIIAMDMLERRRQRLEGEAAVARVAIP